MKGTFYFLFFIFWVGLESWEGLAWESEKVMRDLGGFFWRAHYFFGKKKKRYVRLAVAFWPVKAPFCGIINEEHWPRTSFWRQGGMVLAGRIFQMVSTISSINSGSGLQLQEHSQLLLLLLLFFFFYYKKNRS